jgi:peptidoglycan L-alanyl-D-glutamate endopeptidase CwlK
MPFILGPQSRRELTGVHPRLVGVVERAAELCEVVFGAHDGLRTPEEQAEYVRAEVSDTLNSKHLPQADGFGHAVDLVPFINGKYRWEWPPIYRIALAVHRASIELRTPLIWGAVWDRRFDQLGAGDGTLEDDVEAYAARKRAADIAAGKKPRVFLDGPHYQLHRSAFETQGV